MIAACLTKHTSDIRCFKISARERLDTQEHLIIIPLTTDVTADKACVYLQQSNEMSFIVQAFTEEIPLSACSNEMGEIVERDETSDCINFDTEEFQGDF